MIIEIEKASENPTPDDFASPVIVMVSIPLYDNFRGNTFISFFEENLQCLLCIACSLIVCQ